MAIVASAAVLAISGFGLYKWIRPSPPPFDPGRVEIRRLTDHGRVVAIAGTAVSPDGKWIAYSKRDQGRSLRVKQIATGSEVEVAHVQGGLYFGEKTFTPDGNFLYFRQNDPANPNVYNIYAVPSLGGTSKLILRDVFGAVSFSPDGKRVVCRRVLNTGGDQLLIANADGSGERTLANAKELVPGAVGLDTDPVWAPFSDLIGVAVFKDRVNNTIPIIFATLTLEGKIVKSIELPRGLDANSFTWLPDTSGLFFEGDEKNNLHRRIWYLPYASGEPFRLTNDLDQYSSVSLSSDGKALVSIQSRPESRIYVTDSPSTFTGNETWKLQPISDDRISGISLSWSAEGKLLESDDNGQLYFSAADGSSRSRLFDSADFLIANANVCGSGDTVNVIRIEDNNQSLWRFNTTTKELRKLSFGLNDFESDCGPDGKLLVLNSFDLKAESWVLSLLGTDGGSPKELARGQVYFPRVSPNGKFVSFLQFDGQGQSRRAKFVIKNLEDGSDREIPAPPNVSYPSWTPDAHAIAFIYKEDGPGDLYVQNLSGGKPIRIMHFDEEPSSIAAYAWSRDGKKIAVTRARFNDSDVVLFTGLR